MCVCVGAPHLDGQRAHSFPVGLDAAQMAVVVVGVVGPPLGRDSPQRVVPPPLRQQRVIAEGAHQGAAVLPELLRVRVTLDGMRLMRFTWTYLHEKL